MYVRTGLVSATPVSASRLPSASMLSKLHIHLLPLLSPFPQSLSFQSKILRRRVSSVVVSRKSAYTPVSLLALYTRLRWSNPTSPKNRGRKTSHASAF